MIWYILLGVVAFIWLLMLVPLSLTVTIDEAGVTRLRGRILGITVYRSPKHERTVKLSDYTPRAIKKRERSAKRKRDRLARRAQRKAKKQQRANRGKETLTPPETRVPLGDKISFIKSLAEVVLRRSLKHARVDVERLTITVATPDAAKTAILYGAVCTALAALTEVLDRFSRLRIRDADQYGVTVDFLGERTHVDIRLHFRLRVHHVLDIGLHALLRLIKRIFEQSKR